MSEWRNDWDAIRRFYELWNPVLLRHRQDEWAMDAYEWDNGMLRMTPIEQWLWADIRNNSAVLYPQYPVGRIFVDFANPVAKVAIECDGAAFHMDKEKDRTRDEMLRSRGWSVYRITGSDCRTESKEETGEPGAASEFVRRIAERHSIARCPVPGEWALIGEGFSAEVLFEMRVRAEISGMVSKRRNDAGVRA